MLSDWLRVKNFMLIVVPKVSRRVMLFLLSNNVIFHS